MLKDENGQVFSNPQVVANKLNSHFVNKRLKLASELPTPQISIYKNMGPRIMNTISSSGTTPAEVLKYIKELQANKAPYDKLTPKIVKWLENELAPVLTRLGNRFLTLGNIQSPVKPPKLLPFTKVGTNKTVTTIVLFRFYRN